ncbi:helix-turn-helix domain-containing protein [Streptomyces sp. NPDC050485]|uniref:helix-turn-helix domain-containing protein n=1 Tax=Streptomyces sp. NPDC050485 TaxID=3365617 RepID=UPI0037A23E7E
MTAEELGEFLRARRAALTPADSGVPTYATPRRVPGLRRDEVAHLAGISVNYYTRLEQGESHQMSDSVLQSLGGALQLTVDERAHLLRLARPVQARQTRRPYGPEQLRPSSRWWRTPSTRRRSSWAATSTCWVRTGSATRSTGWRPVNGPTWRR